MYLGVAFKKGEISMTALYEPLTIIADMKHSYFDRNIAVKEGYRESVEINKDKTKRPFILARKHLNKYLFNKNDLYGKENLIIRAFEDKNKSLNRIVKKITDKKKLIDVAELDKHENLKDKTIFVYIEKYSDNVYTVREDRYRDSQVTANLYSEQFFGIAGEFMIINFNKIDGKYHFKYVVPSYDYWIDKRKR